MTSLYKRIGRGRKNFRKYGIWSILENGQRSLFKYMVIWEDSLSSADDFITMNKMINEHAVDVGTLNIIDDEAIEQNLYSDRTVVLILADAVRRGIVHPI